MKRIIFAATALLFSTSALAIAPAGADPVVTSEKNKAAFTGMAVGAKAPKAALAAMGMKAKVASAAWHEGEAKIVAASATTWDKADPTAGGNPDLDLAETSIDETQVATQVESEPAMGGPYEPVETADTAPLAAAGNYPPCRPGPGDDRCIQLYEPGVRTALAAWTQPTGGLIDESATAMGGPYEPVDDEAATETAMNGDGSVDATVGETIDAEMARQRA